MLLGLGVLAVLMMTPPAVADHDSAVCHSESAEMITATQHDDGSITLDWDDAYGVGTYTIERRANGGEWEVMESFHRPSMWTDTNTTVGITYEYRVESHRDAQGFAFDPLCVETTAIPFFGAPALAVLGALGAAGTYGVLSRRRHA